MAVEFVRRDELAIILAQLIGRLDAIQANQTAMRGDVAALQAGQTAMREDAAAFQTHVDQRLDEVVDFQQSLKETTKAHARDLTKQLADIAASLQGQINDLKQQ